MAGKNLTRRESLKLLLTASAAWLGSLIVGRWTAGWPGPQVLGKGVPIEGLGLGIKFTNFLRSAGITTISRLRDVMGGADPESRTLLARDTRLAEILPLAQNEITARLAAFAMFGPVPFETLTRQEDEILRLVAQGDSDKQIAERLRVTRRIVSMNLESLFRKLQGLCAPYAA